ncbi:hypothetical protein D030_2551B, partial [Vibrio parahaemolyticus AQ3810]
LVPVCLQKS